MPSWYLSLVTAGVKDVSLAEQKRNNVIFGWIRLFSLSKYHEVLLNTHSGLSSPW